MHKAQTDRQAQERQRATDSTTARPTARPEISRLADHALSTPNIMLAAPMAPMLRLPPIAQARAAPPSMDILSDPALFLYELQLSADSLVSQQLGGTLTPFSGLSLFGAGLLTSLTPCCLSCLQSPCISRSGDGEPPHPTHLSHLLRLFNLLPPPPPPLPPLPSPLASRRARGAGVAAASLAGATRAATAPPTSRLVSLPSLSRWA